MAGQGMLHCVSVRCRICRFLFQPGDKVIADLDGRLFGEFPFGSGHTDKDLGVLLRPCKPSCSWCGQHDSGRVLGYHAGCLALCSLPSGAFLHATEYSFEPDASEEERRHRWTIALLADRMSKMHLPVPTELRFLIAQHLVPECATAAAQQAWHDRCSRDSDVDLSLDIWAEYAYIDGIRYISYISNQAVETCTARQIQVAGGRPATALYVLEDHLGIRELVFGVETEHRPTTRSKSGLWWRTVPLTSGRLKIKSDGLKLRHVLSTPAVSNKLWRLPMTLPELRDLRFLTFSPDNALKINMFRMVPLTLNDPDVIGYSVCWGKTLMTLHAHRVGEDLSFYKDFSAAYPRAAWIHIPMSSGERISEIWGRRGKIHDHMGLLLRTNKARQTAIGLPISPRLLLQNGRINPSWTQLCDLPETPNRLFFSLSRLGVHLLSTKEMRNPNATLSMPTPMSCPKTLGILDYFYSAASLEEVVEVTPCRVKLATHSLISGLIFQYANGERACVGDIRLDSLGETLLVQPESRLHLAFKMDRSVGPHATRFCLDSSLDEGTPEWLSLPLMGVLEWWFAYGHCKLGVTAESRYGSTKHALICPSSSCKHFIIEQAIIR
ncbi:hypothetical protein CEP52_014044 [Fusarium oligoseptatum]|uniref:Uncharacterized protein n=1 Tax=Fusarium oligoseptatum TaxID=2604345 RepID=A0A428SQL4_9HYPO|nr:hypothetical protein CEP52_014044 [Fusarium oligoseptatum]